MNLNLINMILITRKKEIFQTPHPNHLQGFLNIMIIIK